jgi:hypothetical protein
MEPYRLDKLASLISHALNPSMVGLGVFAGLTWMDMGAWPAGTAGVFLFSILPGTILFRLRRTGYIDQLYPNDGYQRGRLLLLGATCYFLGSIVLLLVSAPALMVGAGCAFCCNTLLVWLINRKWKISIHATGVGGALLILFLAGGTVLLSLAPTLPLLAWARLRLGSHTLAQVMAGALLGGSATGLTLGLILWIEALCSA